MKKITLLLLGAAALSIGTFYNIKTPIAPLAQGGSFFVTTCTVETHDIIPPVILEKMAPPETIDVESVTYRCCLGCKTHVMEVQIPEIEAPLIAEEDIAEPASCKCDFEEVVFDDPMVMEQFPGEEEVGGLSPVEEELAESKPEDIIVAPEITLRLYPNPCLDMLTIESDDASEQQVQIFDLTGKLCKQFMLNGLTTIDVQELGSAGMYVVRAGDKSYKVVVLE